MSFLSDNKFIFDGQHGLIKVVACSQINLQPATLVQENENDVKISII